VKGDKRWRSNWRAVAPAGATRVELPRSRSARRASEQSLRELSPGTTIVLGAGGPGAGRRCKRAAARAGIALEREYLAFPSAEAPAYLVENARGPISVFVQTVLAVPPRSPLALPLQALFSLIRRARAWGLLGVLTPGHLAVGKRV
jgi:hypothetical protein